MKYLTNNFPNATTIRVEWREVERSNQDVGASCAHVYNPVECFMYEAVTGKRILLHTTQHANRYLLMKCRRTIHCLETSLSAQLSTADNNRIFHIRLQERIETSSDIGKHFRFEKNNPIHQKKRRMHYLKGTAGTPSESRCRKRLGGRSTAKKKTAQGLQLCLTKSITLVPSFTKQLPKRLRSTTRHKMKKKNS